MARLFSTAGARPNIGTYWNTALRQISMVVR
jgi:hypothetical protein